VACVGFSPSDMRIFCRMARGPGAAGGGAIVFRQHPVCDVLVDVHAECVRDDLRNPRGQPNRGLRDLSSRMAWIRPHESPLEPIANLRVSKSERRGSGDGDHVFDRRHEMTIRRIDFTDATILAHCVSGGAMWVDSRDARESTAARKDRIETEIAGRFVTISPY
jgi:hypothetical protein